MIIHFIFDYIQQNLGKDFKSKERKLITIVQLILSFIGKTQNELGTQIRSFIFTIIGLGFVACVGSAQFTFSQLYVIKQKPEDVFYVCKDGQKIDLNYQKWNNSRISIFENILKVFYISIQDIYLTGLIIFSVLLENRLTLIIVTIVFMAEITQKALRSSGATIQKVTKNIIRCIIGLIMTRILFQQTYKNFQMTNNFFYLMSFRKMMRLKEPHSFYSLVFVC